MINVSAEHLGSILSRIDDALVLHDKWRENLQRSLICRQPPPESDLSDRAHEQCAFGQWLYSKGNAHLLSLPVFRTMEAMHKEMHVHVRRLYEKRLAGHLTTVEEYDAYLESAIAFRAEILNLKKRVAFMMNNIDPLTGAYRQAQLLAELRAVQQRQRESGEACSLFHFDLDLKELNREFGRTAGDRVLQAAIANVRQAITAKDRIYRLLGAQFVVCLPGKNARDAEQMKAPLLAGIAEAVSATTGKSDEAFKVSFDIVELASHADLEAVLDQAVRLKQTINM